MRRNALFFLAVIASIWARGAGAQHPTAFGTCVSRSEQPRRVGCLIVTETPQGTLGPGPVYWHVARLDSGKRITALPARATSFDSFGHTWLMAIGDSAWRPSVGEQVAVIGPLPITPGTSYNALYMEASMRPGMKSAVHRHSGAEAWYTLAGETCLETPSGTQVGRVNSPVIVPGGSPMELTATGTTLRRSLVLILHDATQPPTTVLTTWKPRHLCDKMK
jgi:quercetin dioxygenase-like cupin family protein